MRLLCLAGAAVLCCPVAKSCSECRLQAMAEVFTPALGQTLTILLLPLALMGMAAVALGRFERPIAK
ncbi:MAG: hypothetical protein KIT11_01300 [Fimbriimonadaceae bacterium]|nr:hypothetical protein [Fimbriimonadaceae bacterium]QYK54990.1 MAG: hypothetical protein KF733_08235 [Fimbriimonadaceae bacterium]